MRGLLSGIQMYSTMVLPMCLSNGRMWSSAEIRYNSFMETLWAKGINMSQLKRDTGFQSLHTDWHHAVDR